MFKLIKKLFTGSPEKRLQGLNLLAFIILPILALVIVYLVVVFYITPQG